MTSPEAHVRLWAELEQLATRRDLSDRQASTLQVSDHAVLRFRERVEGLPRRRARHRIEALLVTAQWEALPRSWMPIVLHLNTHYGYPIDRPDVCLLERDGYIVTVLSQRFVRQHARRASRRVMR